MQQAVINVHQVQIAHFVRMDTIEIVPAFVSVRCSFNCFKFLSDCSGGCKTCTSGSVCTDCFAEYILFENKCKVFFRRNLCPNEIIFEAAQINVVHARIIKIVLTVNLDMYLYHQDNAKHVLQEPFSQVETVKVKIFEKNLPRKMFRLSK